MNDLTRATKGDGDPGIRHIGVKCQPNALSEDLIEQEKSKTLAINLWMM